MLGLSFYLHGFLEFFLDFFLLFLSVGVSTIAIGSVDAIGVIELQDRQLDISSNRSGLIAFGIVGDGHNRFVGGRAVLGFDDSPLDTKVKEVVTFPTWIESNQPGGFERQLLTGSQRFKTKVDTPLTTDERKKRSFQLPADFDSPVLITTNNRNWTGTSNFIELCLNVAFQEGHGERNFKLTVRHHILHLVVISFVGGFD